MDAFQKFDDSEIPVKALTSWVEAVFVSEATQFPFLLARNFSKCLCQAINTASVLCGESAIPGHSGPACSVLRLVWKPFSPEPSPLPPDIELCVRRHGECSHGEERGPASCESYTY